MAYAYHRFARQGAFDDDFGEAVPTKRRLPEVIDLVERKLEWFGLHSMKIAHICITDDSIRLDLVSKEDESTCRMEIDRRTNAITRCDGLLPSSSVSR